MEASNCEIFVPALCPGNTGASVTAGQESGAVGSGSDIFCRICCALWRVMFIRLGSSAILRSMGPMHVQLFDLVAGLQLLQFLQTLVHPQLVEAILEGQLAFVINGRRNTGERLRSAPARRDSASS